VAVLGVRKEALMHPLIADNMTEIERLCRTFRVRRLDLFGSIVGDGFDASTSDVDVLVEFDRGASTDLFDSYFGLKESLEQLFGRPVDLVDVHSLRNPYFREQVMRTRRGLYAA
jgi:predicted nucleotidyltransferase